MDENNLHGFMIIVMIMTIFFSGCIGSSGESRKEDSKKTFLSDAFQMGGTVEALAQTSPDTVTEEIHFLIENNHITRIRINVSIEDNDDDTWPDHIDQIRMWRENEGEETEIRENTGGYTPYVTTNEFEYTGEEQQATWWIVEITATCVAGEDTWPGPILWSGVPDRGVSYTIEADYDYYDLPNIDEE